MEVPGPVLCTFRCFSSSPLWLAGLPASGLALSHGRVSRSASLDSGQSSLASRKPCGPSPAE